MKRTVLLALTGTLSGAANGLFGAGGGMIAVPLLGKLCRLDARAVFPTAMGIMLPTCMVSLSVYLLHGALDFPLALPYLAGGVLGGIGGGLLYPHIPTKWLHRGLGILIVYGGVRLLLT
ncbi:MAG: sulfite exporter TauE/SafE family protein [Oscillospiraceae bacterium]|nr:sulfite exporter TauE/SafE family protein [Oscillospiraceae bacterium]